MDAYRECGEAAWSWVVGQVRGADGPWLPEVVRDDEPPAPTEDRDSLYAGIAGLAPVLAEIGAHRALTAVEESLAAAIVARLSAAASVRVEASLFDGLAGDVVALRLLAPGSERVALHRLAELATPAGWESTTAAGVPGSGPSAVVIDRPDQWWAVPGHVRGTGPARGFHGRDEPSAARR